MLEPIKRVYRSREGAVIGGVCAGFGDYFRLDPVLIRLALVGFALVTAVIPALLLYAVAWFLVPQEPHRLPSAPPAAQPQGQ